MRALFKDNIVEALVGLIVVIVAIGFVAVAYARTSAGNATDGYPLKARFTNVAGVSPGTDVRMAGIKVGKVAAQSLDPASFQAVIVLSIDKGLNLPIDSSAAVTTEGILGGTFISITPGGEEAILKPGEEIVETSGATDLMALIGGFVNKSGDKPAETPTVAPAPGQ